MDISEIIQLWKGQWRQLTADALSDESENGSLPKQWTCLPVGQEYKRSSYLIIGLKFPHQLFPDNVGHHTQIKLLYYVCWGNIVKEITKLESMCERIFCKTVPLTCVTDYTALMQRMMLGNEIAWLQTVYGRGGGGGGLAVTLLFDVPDCFEKCYRSL